MLIPRNNTIVAAFFDETNTASLSGSQEFFLYQAQRDREVRELQAAQEERLAVELSRIKNEETRDEKMRQHVRETSLELRELEAKLKAAYTNMERHAQMAEKEALKYDKMVRHSRLTNKILEICGRFYRCCVSSYRLVMQK